MITTTKIDFALYSYSDGAVDQVVKQVMGKPFLDENRKPIGTIVEASRVYGTKIVEFKIKPA